MEKIREDYIWADTFNTSARSGFLPKYMLDDFINRNEFTTLMNLNRIPLWEATEFLKKNNISFKEFNDEISSGRYLTFVFADVVENIKNNKNG